MLAIYKKELRSYFTSLTGYVAISVILVLTGFFIKVVAFDAKYAFIENVLPAASVILLVAVPIITMSSFASERQGKTDSLLYSLPISTGSIVMGKYLAMLTVFSVPVLFIGVVPIILSMYGNISFFGVYSALFTFFLLISAMTAICMFMSVLTESQVIAAVLGAGTLLTCYFANLLTGVIPKTSVASLISFIVISALLGLVVYYFVKDKYIALACGIVFEIITVIVYIIDGSLFKGLIQRAVGLIAIFDLFSITVSSKVLDLGTAVYFLSLSVIFVFLTAQAFEKRRYS